MNSVFSVFLRDSFKHLYLLGLKELNSKKVIFYVFPVYYFMTKIPIFDRKHICTSETFILYTFFSFRSLENIDSISNMGNQCIIPLKCVSMCPQINILVIIELFPILNLLFVYCKIYYLASKTFFWFQ